MGEVSPIRREKFRLIVDPRLEGKYSLKSVQKLALIANRCLIKLAKNRPKMSEVLEMVNKIAEASTDTASPPLPLKNLASMDSSRNSEAKNKRRLVDTKSGENSWSFRVWPPKLVRTC